MTIVISQNLVLAGATSYDPALPLIGWQNQVTATGTTADFEAAEHPAVNLANPATNLYWRSTDTVAQYLTFAVDEEQPIDYIGIAGHNFGSGGTVISVEYQQFDSVDWVELVEGFVVADDAPIIVAFRETLVSNIRIKLTPDGSTPEAAVVHIGAMLAMTSGIIPGHTPLEVGRTTRLAVGVAESGDYLGKIVLAQIRRTQVAFRPVEGDWYWREMEPFISQGIGTTFFYAGFPQSRPRAVGYCWLASDPRPVFRDATGRVDVSLDIGGVVD